MSREETTASETAPARPAAAPVAAPARPAATRVAAPARPAATPVASPTVVGETATVGGASSPLSPATIYVVPAASPHAGVEDLDMLLDQLRLSKYKATLVSLGCSNIDDLKYIDSEMLVAMDMKPVERAKLLEAIRARG